MINNTVAFIPVRGGSKSIPLKNIKEIAGKPLVYWTVKAASECQYIDKVYVATDSDTIGQIVEGFHLPKVEVIGRSKESATDTASTESVMLEFAERYEFEDIVLIQATSPLLTATDLKQAFENYQSEGVDSVLSVVRQKRFVWAKDESGCAYPVNYDYNHRPRRQEFDGYMVENGAFYITSKKLLMTTKCRISGNIFPFEMDEITYFEIDEPSDWVIIEHQLNRREKIQKIPDIKMVLMDCDGVLTDGGMYYTEQGDEIKRFNTLDGMGISRLREKGILVGIVTGENRELNMRRAEKLKMDIIRQGVSDKLVEIKQICSEKGISLDNVLYVGDDINDLEAIKAVGYGCSVANGREEVKLVAKYVTKTKGGEGAVREIADLIVNGGK